MKQQNQLAMMNKAPHCCCMIFDRLQDLLIYVLSLQYELLAIRQSPRHHAELAVLDLNKPQVGLASRRRGLGGPCSPLNIAFLAPNVL